MTVEVGISGRRSHPHATPTSARTYRVHSTGVYNWDFVHGIETIVNWCRAHGVKVMFTVLDNWSTVDSKSAVR